jgi:hypothetical protein
MFQFIRLWVLRYQLAPIFKQAELATERGTEKGNLLYASLYNKADELITAFELRYPKFDSTPEFGQAMAQLEDLMQSPEPVDHKPKIALAIGLFIFAGIGVGTFGAIVFWTYHALTLFAH